MTAPAVNPSHAVLLELLEQRASCRVFAPGPLGADILNALSRAFALAPAAGGDRNVRCRFLTDAETIRNTAGAGAAAFDARCAEMDSPFVREHFLRYGRNFFWFGQAPALAIVTCRRPPGFIESVAGADAESLWGGEASAAMAVFALLLAAESLNVGACCLTGPLAVRSSLERLLDLPERERLAMLVAVGAKPVSGVQGNADGFCEGALPPHAPPAEGA